MKTQIKTQFKIGAVFLIAILSMCIGYTIAQSGNTFIISQGVYPHAVSYTFFIEGAVYYRKDAYGLSVSSLNCSYLIANILTSGDRTLYFRIGNYKLDVPILIEYSGIHIIGENKEATILEAKNDVDIIHIEPLGAYVGNIQIANLHLKGKGKAITTDSWGIRCVYQSWYSTFENIVVTETFGGINFSSTDTTRGARSYFENIHIYNTNTYGLYFKEQDNHQINKLDVHGTTYGIFFDQKTQGIRMEGVASDQNSGTGFTFKDCQVITGIDIFASDNEDYGIFIDSSKQIKLTNFYIESSGEANLVIGSTIYDTFDIRLINGEIVKSNKTGIQIGSNIAILIVQISILIHFRYTIMVYFLLILTMEFI